MVNFRFNRNKLQHSQSSCTRYIVGVTCMLLILGAVIWQIVSPHPRRQLSTLTASNHYFINHSDRILNNLYNNQDIDNDLRKLIFGSNSYSYTQSKSSSVLQSCADNLPLFVSYSTHHKCGTVISGKIRQAILKYCHLRSRSRSKSTPTSKSKSRSPPVQYDFDQLYQYIVSNNNNNNDNNNSNQNSDYYQTYYRYFYSKRSRSLQYMTYQRHWPRSFPDTEIYKKYFDTNIVLIHYIRSPLDTIISGFNYHSSCDHEKWGRCILSTNQCRYMDGRWHSQAFHESTPYYNFIANININNNINIIDQNFNDNDIFARRLKFVRRRGDYDYLPRNVFDDYKRGGFIRYEQINQIAKQKFTTCGLYSNYKNKNENINYNSGSMGNKFNDLYMFPSLNQSLYFEFVRYINAEFDEMYHSYVLIKNYQYGYNIRMQDYTRSSQDFDNFIKYLMIDILNLPQNEFKTILKRFVSIDIHRMKKKKYKSDSHIATLGKETDISKTDQIDRLLKIKYVTDDSKTIHVCKYIKRMMLLLDYQWESQYQAYC